MTDVINNDVQQALEWLDEAADEVASWGAYAHDYFQQKWKLAEAIEGARTHSATIRQHIAALTAEAEALRRDAAGAVGAIDENGEPYLYLSTDLPRGTRLYAEPHLGSDAVTEALHNAIALFGGRCTDAPQLVWLESAKAALAARTGKAGGVP